MEHKLAFGALGLGVLGWGMVAALLGARPEIAAPASETAPKALSAQIGGHESFRGLAFLLPVLVWLASLPVHSPFSAGQGWGRGFLLGGGIAALNLAMIGAFSRGGSGARTAGALSLFGAIAAASVPLLWMRSAIIEALLGAALGWIAVSLVWLLGSDAERAAPNPVADGIATWILNAAVFAATLLGTAALGVSRDFVARDVPRGTFPALALTVAASVALLFLVGALLDAITSRRAASPSIASSKLVIALSMVVPLGTAYLLATRVLDDLAAFYVVAIGTLLGAVLWLLVRDEAPRSGRPTRVALPAILVALCAWMLSYQIMQGFGVGLMLLTAWPASLLSLPHLANGTDLANTADSADVPSGFEVAHTLSMLAAFGALTLLSRVFATRYHADLRGAGLDDQFSLFGFVAGATLPHLLTTLWFDARPDGSRSLWQIFPASASGARLICLGILAMLLPAAMLLLWGIKIGPAFLLGLAICVVGEAGPSRKQQSVLALWALGLSIAVCQWSQKVLPLAEISRAQRLHWLFWGVGITLILILLLDYGARLFSGMRRGATKTGTAL